MTKNFTMEPEPYSGGYHRVVQTLKLIDNGHRYSLGFVPEGKGARKVTGGPDVPGPWATAFGLAVCLDNHGGTGKESADRIEAGLEFEVGIDEVISIGGVEYRVDFYSRGCYIDRHNIELKAV